MWRAITARRTVVPARFEQRGLAGPAARRLGRQRWWQPGGVGDSVGDFLVETEAERAKRHAQRRTFGSVAELYEATRQGYPAELVDGMASTAGVGPGDRVLEIGCGTGQLTRQLLDFRFALTALDISPEMVAVARSHPGMDQVGLVATAFEGFDAADDSYALIASATAFPLDRSGHRSRQGSPAPASRRLDGVARYRREL